MENKEEKPVYDDRCGTIPMSQLALPPYERLEMPIMNGNVRHVPREIEDALRADEEKEKARLAAVKKEEQKKKDRERNQAKKELKRKREEAQRAGIEFVEPVEMPPNRKRKSKVPMTYEEFEREPIIGAYMRHYGLTRTNWDAERNGPIMSRVITHHIAYMAMKYPYQYVRVSEMRDPAKFIHIIILCHKTRYLQFLIRNDNLNNSQFDELDFDSFPERIIRRPPIRFWHWIAGAVPQVDWYDVNGDHIIYTIEGLPKYYPTDDNLREYPHEIGLLSNKRYDGSVIDETRGDVRDRGIFLYVCDTFLPVPPHLIAHWCIFEFPFMPVNTDWMSNRQKPPEEKKKRARKMTGLGAEVLPQDVAKQEPDKPSEISQG